MAFLRHIALVVKGNMKKSKNVYISIFVLMLIVSITLFSVITYYKNSYEREEQAIEEAGFGDMFAASYSNYQLEKIGINSEIIVQNIEKSDHVSNVNASEAIYTYIKDCNGKSGNNTVFVISEKDKNIHFTQYNSDNEIIENELNTGEISVPVSFVDLYGCKIGDTIILGNKYDSMELKVVSFFEDAYMGSSIMGIKTLIVSEEDFNKMIALADEGTKYEESEDGYAGFSEGLLLNIFQSKNSNLSSIMFEKELNSVSNYANYCWISLSREQAVKYMMTFTNIFSVILIVFVFVLLMAALVVLGHNISSSIELDYKNIGILKSVGMTNKSIKVALILGYISTAAAGMIIGMPLSTPVIGFINNTTLTSMGIYVSDDLDILLILGIILVVLLMICIYICIKTTKISKISPLKAINEGNSSVHFSSFLKLPISKKMLNSSIAYRQFISEKKQYISAIAVTAVLTLSMLMMNDACIWANGDMSLFSLTDSDMFAGYNDKAIETEVEDIIGKYTDYEKYQVSSKYLLFDDMQIYCYILDKPEEIRNIIDGRACKYNNEIMVTPYLIDGFGLQIGDKITIKHEGEKADYIISGVYDSANDQGKNFAMSYEGYKRIVKVSENNNQNSNVGVWGNVYYKLNDKTKIQDILKEVSSKLGESDEYFIKGTKENMSEYGADIISVAINGLTGLIYLLGGIFVMITVFIVCDKIIIREKKDYGIYKSIGFTNKKIRAQLAARFAITAFLGSVLGIILFFIFSGKMFDAIFSEFGVYSYESQMSCLYMIIPVILMTVLFALFAYIKARKVKKTEVRILIVE